MSTRELSSKVAARSVGSIIGLLIGIALVLYLDARKTPPAPAISATATQTQTQTHTQAPPPQPVKHHDPQAAEIARLKLAIEARRIMDLLSKRQTQNDQTRPEILQYTKLSAKELDAEIEAAVSAVSDYAALARYAPLPHQELYRRVNLLYDVDGLSDPQNKWLGQALGTLNELSVRHAEDAWKKGDAATAIRAADALGEWTFRLNKKQEPRLQVVLSAVAADARLSH